MASGSHRQAAQSLLNSLCFFIATLQSHTRGVWENVVVVTARRQSCLQIKAASLKYFEQKNSDQEKTWKHTSKKGSFCWWAPSLLFFSTDQPVQIGVPEDPKIKTSEILRKMFIHWERMKREQTQHTIPSLAKKFVAILKFHPLSLSYLWFYILDWKSHH